MTRDEPPQKIARYEIVSQLGRGAMSRVYLARDPNTDRHVALKLLDPVLEALPEEAEDARRRFLQEARAAGRLHHPGIVMVYDADTDAESGRSFLAMEWVEGRSLAEWLKRERPLPWPAAARLAAEVARALEHAHAHGIVHRDIKPANILIDRDGRVKVSDFGIAKLATDALTHAGQVVGTPKYMSPEQVHGGAIDGRSDLFSLGSVLYEMVTGTAPFKSDSVASVAHRITDGDPVPPRELAPELPAALEGIILCALEKRPSNRFQSAAEMAAALAALADGATSPVPVPAPAAPGAAAALPSGSRTRRHAVVAAAVLLLAVAAAIGLTRERAPAATPPSPATTTDPPPPLPFPEPPPVPDATLEIVHVNRFQGPLMTVWVDGERAWSGTLRRSGGLAGRVKGEVARASIPVVAGPHDVEVRITQPNGRIDARGVVRGDFVRGQTRRLRVVLRPYLRRLGLDWES